MVGEAEEMKKSEANRIAEAQIKEWQERNREPGVLPSIPIIMISSLCGERPGITINLNNKMPLADVVQILKATSEQVEGTIRKLAGN
jgi:hypothetical protein